MLWPAPANAHSRQSDAAAWAFLWPRKCLHSRHFGGLCGNFAGVGTV